MKKISQKIKFKSIDKIITEPYLGPQRNYVDFKTTVRELNNLYSLALTEFNKILKQNGRIVMVWPVFQTKGKMYFLEPQLNNFKIINFFPKNLINNKQLKQTKRQTIVYGRSGQKVWREIVKLEKK